MLEAARKARTLRELQSLCREVAGNDPEAFAELVAIHAEFGAMLARTANELRVNGEYSWADIARPLHVTRSAAQKRFGLGLS